MIQFRMIHQRASEEMLGFLPEFLSESDSRPAAVQFNERYKHGGGWRHFAGFTMTPDGSLQYPNDSPILLLAEAKLRNETIRVYEHAWVAVVQEDGSFEVCRMD